MSEYVLYRWNSESSGVLYFVAPTEQWENHIKNYYNFENPRTELARGTEDEMNRLLKLIGEEE
jgi:hypothetical protein